MPTYGYECTGCSDAFEVVQKMTDDALTTCEKCGGHLKKKIFPVGIAFKGSGFYVNDYAPKRAESDSPKADASKTDAKPTDAKTGDAGSGDAAASAPSAPEAKAPDTKPAETKAATPAAPAAAKE